LSKGFGEFFARRGTLTPEVKDSLNPLKGVDLHEAILSLSQSIVDALPASDASWAEGDASETVSPTSSFFLTLFRRFFCNNRYYEKNRRNIRYS
jgi:hypothetical protein